MKSIRVFTVVYGILHPYIARIPGSFLYGADWLLSYCGDNPVVSFLFFAPFNAICWGSILLATFTYRSACAAWFPFAFGFAVPMFCHSGLDVGTDAQAGIALVFVPIFALPLVVVGWLIGLWVDRRFFGPGTASVSAVLDIRSSDNAQVRREPETKRVPSGLIVFAVVQFLFAMMSGLNVVIILGSTETMRAFPVVLQAIIGVAMIVTGVGYLKRSWLWGFVGGNLLALLLAVDDLATSVMAYRELQEFQNLPIVLSTMVYPLLLLALLNLRYKSEFVRSGSND
jgi:hypothetical protein